MMFDVVDAHISEWGEDLRAWTDGVGHLFSRPEPREIFGDLVEGLLSDLEKKNGWTLAQRAGHGQPGRIQTFLSRGAWSADGLEVEVRDRVMAEMASPEAVLIVDDTQMVKKGRKSVGVAPQHCGATNTTENCQVAVMLTYATDEGHAFIGHRLYLPARWTDDPARCREAGVPASVTFATKPEQAVQSLAEAVAAGTAFGWIASDGGYGQYAVVRHWCRDRSLRYVMAVPSSLALDAVAGTAAGQRGVKRVDDLLTRVPESDWERRSRGAGAKGRRFYDWAFFTVAVKDEAPAAGFAHTLLIRRSIADPTDVAYFLIHAPTGTPVAKMVEVAGTRWRIEECNEQGKDLLGLDQYQVPTWPAWHHFVTTCMFAHAFLVTRRVRLARAHTDTEGDRPQPGVSPEHAQDLGKGRPTTPNAPPGSALAGSR